MSNLAEKHLWLVRHSETAWSKTDRHTSYTDLPLTDKGRARAAELKPLLEGVDFARVISSPVGRALQTGALAGFDHPEIVDDLVEWNYGDYEGLTTDQIRETEPGWSIWSAPCPGGELHEHVAARLDRVISLVRETDGPVLAFGHGHAMRVLTARWLGLGARDGRFFILDAGAASILGAEHEWPAIRAWNLTG